MKQTVLQELRQDLVDTKLSAKQALENIQNKEKRNACQEVVRLTLNNIIKRIDEELLELEKEQIIDAYNQGCLDTLKDGMKRGEQYYNKKYKQHETN